MIGLSPLEIGSTSLGQWAAIVSARRQAEGQVAPPTEDEFLAAVARGF